MYVDAHHELTTVNTYSVHQQDDTGKHKLDDIIEGVSTGMYYEPSALIPIYHAYNAVTLAKGCSASKLRDAFRLRLTQDNLIPLVADVTLDENEPIWIDSD